MFKSSENSSFEALGKTVRGARKHLETFPKPEGVTNVIMTSHEFTSVCPITGQPDFGSVEISYRPRDKCLESKSLKLYLMTFREAGTFCEALAAEIARDVQEVLDAECVKVTVTQVPRGGVGIKAEALTWKTLVDPAKMISIHNQEGEIVAKVSLSRRCRT